MDIYPLDELQNLLNRHTEPAPAAQPQPAVQLPEAQFEPTAVQPSVSGPTLPEGMPVYRPRETGAFHHEDITRALQLLNVPQHSIPVGRARLSPELATVVKRLDAERRERELEAHHAAVRQWGLSHAAVASSLSAPVGRVDESALQRSYEDGIYDGRLDEIENRKRRRRKTIGILLGVTAVAMAVPGIAGSTLAIGKGNGIDGIAAGFMHAYTQPAKVFGMSASAPEKPATGTPTPVETPSIPASPSEIPTISATTSKKTHQPTPRVVTITVTPTETTIHTSDPQPSTPSVSGTHATSTATATAPKSTAVATHTITLPTATKAPAVPTKLATATASKTIIVQRP